MLKVIRNTSMTDISQGLILLFIFLLFRNTRKILHLILVLLVSLAFLPKANAANLINEEDGSISVGEPLLRLIVAVAILICFIIICMPSSFLNRINLRNLAALENWLIRLRGQPPDGDLIPLRGKSVFAC